MKEEMETRGNRAGIQSEFELDASVNSGYGGQDEIGWITEQLLSATLPSLKLNACSLGDDAMQFLLFCFADTGKHAPTHLSLDLAVPWRHHSHKNRQKSVNDLKDVFSNNVPIKSLSIVGGKRRTGDEPTSEWRWGPKLGDALSALASNTCLQKLDITGNYIGNNGS